MYLIFWIHTKSKVVNIFRLISKNQWSLTVPRHLTWPLFPVPHCCLLSPLALTGWLWLVTRLRADTRHQRPGASPHTGDTRGQASFPGTQTEKLQKVVTFWHRAILVYKRHKKLVRDATGPSSTETIWCASGWSEKNTQSLYWELIRSVAT